MAIHASLRRWNPGGGRRFHPAVAVAAIDSVVCHMVLVTELYGLLPRDVLVRHVGGTRDRRGHQERQPYQKKPSKNREARDEVRAAVEDLGHFRTAPEQEAQRRKPVAE